MQPLEREHRGVESVSGGFAWSEKFEIPVALLPEPIVLTILGGAEPSLA